MFFKTLHWYIFRELIRIFVLTASALTTLMALCGVFKPFTKRGIEILQLLSIMMNLMPAMLAYAIPIAALFAAVQVYWRLSTDNELTACRASGISFITIVVPALILGVSVAAIDLGFVNYVVPVFLERTERAILSDIGSLIVSQVGRQENVSFNNFQIYADSAHEEPSNDPTGNTVVVVLEGMAATQLKDGKPSTIVVARACRVTITSNGDSDLHASFALTDASAFGQPKLEKWIGDINSLTGFGSSGLTIPSLLKSKPKFENITILKAFEANPASFPPIHDIIDKIALNLQYQQINSTYLDQWKTARADHQNPLIVEVPGNAPGSKNALYIHAPYASLNRDGQLIFTGIPAKPGLRQPAVPVRIDQYRIYDDKKKDKTLLLTYTAGQVAVNVGAVEYSTNTIAVSFTLEQDVIRTDHVNKIPPVPAEKIVNIPAYSREILPPSARPPDNILLQEAKTSTSAAIFKQSQDADLQITKLQHTIISELHSRSSFAVSCLTLVLLGAALGILLRGKNPLAVFVVGFVPAIFLVLLITAGRELTEGPSNHTVPIGLSLIWAGNAILVILVLSVYAKLLRH